MPGMLRKSTAFVPRYQKFESISLHRRVRRVRKLSTTNFWFQERRERYVKGITVLYNRERDIALATYDGEAAANAIFSLAEAIHGANIAMVARALNSEAEMLFEYGGDRGSNIHLIALIAVRRKLLDAASSNGERAVANRNLGLALQRLGERESGTARLEEAVKAYQAALALEKDADKRRSFTTHFLMAMASCGLAHAAYPVAPDKRDAFGTLAGELKKFYRLDDMAPLVALHTKDDPADPLLPFYQAEVYVRRGQYEKADEAFALGLADPPGLPLLDTFRDSRVLARYHVGKAMAAYNTIGPKEDTFRQLAAICLQDGKFDLLTELLDAHAKTHPDLPDLLLFRCRMKVRQNAVAEAITLFKAGVAKVADELGQECLAFRDAEAHHPCV